MIKNKELLEMIKKRNRKYLAKIANIVIQQLTIVENGIAQKQAYLILMWFQNNVLKKDS